MKEIDRLAEIIRSAKTVFEDDESFQKNLEGLPVIIRTTVKNFLQDDELLINLIRRLPEDQQKQVADVIEPLFVTPGKAKDLIAQCLYFEAREYLKRSIAQYESAAELTPDFLMPAVSFIVRRVQALLYDHLAMAESALGNVEEAGRCHTLAVQYADECGDTDTAAKALLGLTTYYWEMGDYENALQLGHQALEYLAGQRDRWMNHARILTTLSCIYDDIGRHDEAIRYATDAVTLCRQVNDPLGLAYSLNNIACLYMESGGTAEAIPFLEEALGLPEIRKDMAILMLNNLAMCILQGGESDEETKQAYDLLLQGQEDSRCLVNIMREALCRGNQGYAMQRMGLIEEASDAFTEAARLFRKIGHRSQESRYLCALADHLLTYVGDAEGAITACRNAIEIIERIRGGMKKEYHRITYASTVADPYATAVIALLTTGRAEEALEYVERAKSRALLELLTARIMKSGFMMSDSSTFNQAINLLVEMDEIRLSLESAARQDLEWTDVEGPGRRATGATERQHPEELIRVLEEKDRVLTDLCADLNTFDQEKTHLINVQPFNVQEMQQALDSETFILEMFQTDEALLLFCVSNEGVLQYLPIDMKPQEALEIVTYISEAIQRTAHLDIHSHDYIRDVRQPLRDLYTQIAAPLAECFRMFKRCIIIPHGVWHYFPFHVLYDPEEKTFLGDKVEIGYCPSAAVLRHCRMKNRIDRERALLLSHNTGDLPLADEEVQRLSRVFADGCGRIFTGEDAHLGRVSEGPVDIIHLACHGWFVSRQPFMSGIAIRPDEKEERDTYVLDLFNLRLPCSQVTLSACESGLSLATNADELLGLSRGLFSAGAAALMLSLWKVADESTCYLMENYYRQYVRNQQTKTRALQLAMQAVKARPEYAHPYFWAPFVVMGEWR